ncbi:cryptochrome/photolyase family protein [Legionella impletisoli]|uniref:Deoxyribodipyrimidine photo-lyase n=1 Tax=Legionella impletisoli TaxID=343510 RepID=A0A917JN93_9GAMM|nr:deoxyribodipyrimidine photo-lyase [Legionella impletisoli]GGI78560.1 deoxyribodipyrimidine photo-lyase [Legionella impletisoli]
MTGIVWFRNDLRLEDNPALSKACEEQDCLILLYIQDPNTPLTLGDAQTWWLHHSLASLQKTLLSHSLTLCLKYGDSLAVLREFIKLHNVTHIYWNKVYEPAHLEKDTIIEAYFKKEGLTVKTYNAHLLIEPDDIKTQEGSFYKVFTPFWKQCLKKIQVPKAKTISKWPDSPIKSSEDLSELKLLPQSANWVKKFHNYWTPGEESAQHQLEQFINNVLEDYAVKRDKLDVNATSKLSPHLHFGEIGPRQLWRAMEMARNDSRINDKAIDKFLAEVGWREFSYYLLYHFPKLPKKNVQSKFDDFPWEEDVEALKRWQQGQTGYPIVDAGMRELWETGFMHNRARMIVASFLTKDLMIDWRKGADWFLHTLLDADLANNSMGWQWVAGSGADAAPFFRIFNPVLQSGKFDPNGEYIKQWVPELRDIPTKWIHTPWKFDQKIPDYPEPIVNHQEARKLALERYQEIKD